jgi:hypothetical protein
LSNPELKNKYYESIFKQVDEFLTAKMDVRQVQEEIDQHKEIFLKKYPRYREFQNSIFLYSFVENDYKRGKAEELGLMSFEEWRKKIQQDNIKQQNRQ